MAIEKLESIPVENRTARFRNLLHKEFVAGRSKRFWMVQIILSILTVVTAPLIVLNMPPATWNEVFGSIGITITEASILMFFSLAGTIPTFFLPVLTQGVIVDELENGTAAWVISKPVSRTSFILAKFSGNMIAYLGVMVGIPALFGAFVFGFWNVNLTLIGYLLGVGLTILPAAYFLSMTIALGVLLKSRSMAMGISLGIALLGNTIGQMYLPFAIIFPVMLPNYVTPFVAAGVPTMFPASVVPLMVVAPLLQIFIFVGLALFSFRRAEL
ncbi:MAG: ABC transporter permease subunit [Candidatus Thorarchaeota archaeon]|jgi:ABC-2 type transport system permease protein